MYVRQFSAQNCLTSSLDHVVMQRGTTTSFKSYNCAFYVFLARQSQSSANSKAVLYDSLITVDTTSFDQHKLYYSGTSI